MPIFSAGSASVSIVPDFSGAQRAITDFFARQSDVKVGVHPDLSQADLARIQAQINGLRGSATVTIDQNALSNSIANGIKTGLATSGLDKLGSVVNATVMPAMKAVAVGIATEFAAAASQAAGALALIPAGIAAIAIPAAALKIGISGVGDAFKALDTGNLAKINETMGKLAPSAQQFVTQIHDLNPAFSALRLDVQQSLFQGLGAAVSKMAQADLPVLRTGLTGTAGALNGMFIGITQVVSSSAAIGQLRTIFDNVNLSVTNVGKAVASVIQAFLQIAAIGSQFLPPLTAGFAAVAKAFADWVSHAAETGQLVAIIQNAIGVITTLGQIAINVGKVLGGIFSAALPGGLQLIQTILDVTGQIAAMINSVAGQNALTSFFDSVNQVTTALAQPLADLTTALVTAVLPAIGQLATALAPVIGMLATQLANALVALTPLFAPLAQVVGALVAAFAPLIPIIAQIITALLPPLITIFGQLAPIISQVSTIIGAALLSAVQAIAPALPPIGAAFIQILNALLPLLPLFLNLAVQLLPPLLQIVVAMAPGLVALAVAFAQIVTAVVNGGLAPVLTTIANTLATVLTPILGFLADHIYLVVAAIGVWAAISTTMAVVNLVQLAGGIGALLVSLPAVIGALGLVSAATAAWGVITTAAGIAVAVATAPITLIILAIAALGAGIYELVTHWQTVVTFLQTVWNAVVSGVQTGLAALAAYWTVAWNGMLSLFQTVWGAISSFFTTIWNAISSFAQTIWNFIFNFYKTAWDIYSGIWIALWNAVSTVFTTAWNAISSFAQTIWNAISSWFSNAWGVFAAKWEAHWNGISTFFTNIWNAISAFAQQIWNTIANFFTAAWAAFTTGWNIFWNAISTFFTNIWNAIYSFAQSIWNAIASFFTAAWAAFTSGWNIFWNAISTFFTNIWNAISAFAQQIWNSIASFFTNAWAAFTSGWGIFWNAISTFFQSIWNAISAFAQAIWNTIASFFTNAWAAFTSGWNIFWNGVSSFFSTIWNGISSTAQTIWGGISSFFSGAWATFTGAWSAFWDGVGQKFNDIWNGIKTFAGQVWNDIKAIIATPINFVIGTILNGGLFKAWNAVNDFLGLPFHINDLPIIPGFYTGGYTGEAGMFGTTGPGDPAGVVHAKEFVFTANQVDNAGGPDAMYNLASQLDNGYAMGGLVRKQAGDPQPMLNSYVVPPTIAPRINRFLDALTSGQAEAVQAAGGFDAIGPHFFWGGYADANSAGQAFANSAVGKPYVWGGVGPNGYDCSGIQSAVTNVLRGSTDPYSRVGTTADFPWAGFSAGLGDYTIGSSPNFQNSGTGHMASTLAGMNIESAGGVGVRTQGSAWGALHAGFTTQDFLSALGTANPPAPGTANGSGPTAINILGQVISSAADVLTLLGSSIATGVGDLLNSATGGSKWTQMMAKIPDKLMHAMFDKVKDQVGTLIGTLLDGGINTTTPATGAGGSIADEAYLIAQSGFGWGTQADKDALNYIASHESGWNPAAQNPVSTASGIWQLIDSTWNAYKLSKDASIAHARLAPSADQDWAGFGYIKARYGDPIAAQAYWAAHGNYDSGGWLPPGMTQVVNGTGGFEAVLNRAQQIAVSNAVMTPRYDAAPTWHFYLGDREITDLVDTQLTYRNEAQGRHMRSSM